MTEDLTSHRPVATGSKPGNSLDALLAEAFAAEGDTPDERAHAILAREGGQWARLLLREADPEAAPVVGPGSEDAPRESLLIRRYRVEGEIAHGGVGVVLKAHDTTLARDVAVKVLRARHQDTPWMADRFLAEAQIGAQLDHPGVVAVHDAGLLADRRPFFVMKLVRGRTLAALLAERPSPQDQRARFLALFERVCQTLAYAHARSVIHRDLKPSNVMVGAFGEVQVTDWGMAKVLRQGGSADDARAERAEPVAVGVPEPAVATVRSESGSSASIAGSVFGTPSYMAPEQARGAVEELTERTDVFTLGAILCQILTGAPPFVGSRDEALALAQQGDTRAALAAIDGSGADPVVAALARQCLAADPLARPASAQVVADVMARHLAAVEERARAAELSAAKATARAAADRRTRRLALVLLAVVLVAVAVGVTVWTWMEQERAHRHARTARGVDEAIAEGRTLWQTAAPADVNAWHAVTAAARRASTLADSADADPATAERAHSFTAQAAEAAATAGGLAKRDAEDRQLRARLDEIRGMPALDFDRKRQDAAYAALFCELGITSIDTAMESADRLRNHRLVRELAEALDDWRLCRRNLSEDPATWEPIGALARAIDPDPVRNRARALIVTPQLDEARRLAAETDLSQIQPRTILLLAQALRTAGDPTGALAVLRRGQASHADDFWLAMWLAQDTFTPADRAESIRYASTALAIQPRSLHAGVWLSSMLAELGQHEQAIAFMQPLLAHHPDSARLLHNLGSALFALGRNDEAVPHLERAAQLEPTDAKTHYMLGRTLRRLKRNDAARHCFERSVELAPDAPALVMLGMCVSDDLLDHEAARALFARAAAADPKAADARFFLGFMLEKLGRPNEALVEFRSCVALDRRELRGWERIARLELAAQHPAEVQVAAEGALAVDPKCAWAHFMLGNLHLAHGDRELALAAWRAAVEAKADLFEAWHNLGSELVDDPATRAEAIAAYRRALDTRPDFILSRCELARALLLAERLEDAASEAREVLRREPSNERAQALVREIEQRRKQ